jgi:hypothetical protein
MPVFKVHVRQWVEEAADAEVIARDEAEVRAMVYNGDDIDWDWHDGNDARDLEILEIELLPTE